MSPERVGSSNMWVLFPDEYVQGSGGTISGHSGLPPTTVKIQTFYPEAEWLEVQDIISAKRVYVPGREIEEFEKSVQKKLDL